MTYLSRGLLVLLLGVPTAAIAQPPPERYERYDSMLAGEPVASVEVFYDQLSPYGVWVDDPTFGRVFVPDQTDFVPYTSGHWEYTDVGFVWISTDPFAWATVHYGRWVYSQWYHRWAWRPDTTWGPSWVQWRVSGDYFGWAPLMPAGYAVPVEVWHYCSAAHVFDADVARYYEPRRRVAEIHRFARPIDSYATIGGGRVNVGPPRETLRQHHVAVHATTLDTHAAGRWSPVESSHAVKQAEERRATNEALNHRRIENNAPVRDAQ